MKPKPIKVKPTAIIPKIPKKKAPKRKKPIYPKPLKYQGPKSAKKLPKRPLKVNADNLSFHEKVKRLQDARRFDSNMNNVHFNSRDVPTRFINNIGGVGQVPSRAGHLPPQGRPAKRPGPRPAGMFQEPNRRGPYSNDVR